MGSFFLFFQILVYGYISLGLDSGSGADGSCDITGSATTTLSAAKRTYDCTSLTINGNFSDWKASSGSVVIIRVTGDVIVDSGATLDLSGANGSLGINGTFNIQGGAGGAGGFSGGDSGSSAGTNGLNGAGSGAGGGGVNVNGNTGPSFGGGGGGASYGSYGSTTAINGHDSTGIISNTLGSLGTLYGSEENFENEFVGGSGGGAGGCSDDGFGAENSGSSGGGGGGALHIISGGHITINGTIRVNGGNGGGDILDTFTGGGGGSGGAIWLQTKGNIIINSSGSLLALGGTRGENNTGGFGPYGFGGSGGKGRIRLDDGDGKIENAGVVNPGAVITSTTTKKHYQSDISCGSIYFSDDDSKGSGPFSLVFGFFLLLYLTRVLKQISQSNSKV